MKTGRLVLVFAAVLSLAVEADAMPRYYGYLACEYCEYSMSDAYAMGLLYMFDDYRFYIDDLEKEIAAFKNDSVYTEERIRSEIVQINHVRDTNGDWSEVPTGTNFRDEFQNYVFAKGQYKYESGIVAVYPSRNLPLRSQPNPKAKVIRLLLENVDDVRGNDHPDVLCYLGEWTNPQGETWVAVFMEEEDSGITIAGWIDKRYARFITAGQINEVIRKFEELKPGIEKQLAPKSRRANVSTSDEYDDFEGLSAEQLIRDYGNNPFKAQKTYQGKDIEIRGKIHKITSENGVPLIQFPPYAVDSGSAQVYCYVSMNDPLLADIETGRYVTIKGLVSEVDTGNTYPAYKLTDCKIISAR